MNASQRRAFASLAALLLASPLLACSSNSEEKSASSPPPPACESAQFEGSAFTHCLAVPGLNTIHTALVGPEGKPYRTLSQLALARTNAPAVAFAMNAGMFNGAGFPVGYYVEDGERRQKLNTNDGPGNFHMKPNGVFFGNASGHWRIVTSQDFATRIAHRPDFGTQSGPMLVIDGKIHPAFDEDGTSRKMRNAVGIDRIGRAHFVISEEPVSFGRLARYFRDELKCPNALFLDGSVSSLWDPEHGRLDSGPELGPLIVVEKSAKAQGRKGKP